ncbi:hypothetical protein AGMMS50249_7070 [candidate division SR1 bacterium]|nr:hypothetical protein AGMMS50249_7070 [candidate division SR1 bacterium]
MTDINKPFIPYDMYESSSEIVIIMPLGGVQKESLEIKIENYQILIKGEREKPELNELFVSIQEQCYWGVIDLEIDIPPQVYFDKIHSKLSGDNTLQIIVPKALVPEKIELEIE